MPVFRLPLSGNVTQSILPWTWNFNSVGGQIGLVNIDLGQSSEPKIEAEVMTDVASYGKQLGRIEDALVALLDVYTPRGAPTEKQERAFDALREMVGKVEAIKRKHGRP